MGSGSLLRDSCSPPFARCPPPGLETGVVGRIPGIYAVVIGEVLDYDIYRHGRLLHRDGGYLTIGVEDKRIRLIENTLEIVEVLDSTD